MKNIAHTETMVLVYTTIQVYETAIDLAEKAVNAGHAGCVNITKHGTSVYKWKGALLNEDECFVLFKTTKEKSAGLVNFIHEHHPHEIPACVVIDAHTSPAFIEFLKG